MYTVVAFFYFSSHVISAEKGIRKYCIAPTRLSGKTVNLFLRRQGKIIQVYTFPYSKYKTSTLLWQYSSIAFICVR